MKETDKMDTFNLVSIVVLSVMTCITPIFIIVMATLPGPEERDHNTVCFNVHGTMEYQHSLTDLMNKKLEWTLNKLTQEENLSEDKVRSPDMKPGVSYDDGSITVKNGTKTGCTDATTLKDWKISSVEKGGVCMNNGRIIVPLGGHYFVYSFVDFHEVFGPNEESSENQDCDIDHGIYKFNIIEGEEKRLISSLQPHQVPYGRPFNIYNSFVCLLVELRAGDEVSVKVNHPRFIRDTKYNVFGLIMI